MRLDMTGEQSGKEPTQLSTPTVSEPCTAPASEVLRSSSSCQNGNRNFTAAMASTPVTSTARNTFTCRDMAACNFSRWTYWNFATSNTGASASTACRLCCNSCGLDADA